MPTRAASAFTYALLISSFVWASVTKPPSFWHYTNIRRIHNPEKTFSASDFSSETLTAALYTTDIFSKAILLLTLYHTILYNANFHFYIYFRCFVVFPVGNFHHAYRTHYHSEKEFKKAVDTYILFYNSKRPHKTLQYKTPDQVEIEFAEKLDK